MGPASRVIQKRLIVSPSTVTLFSYTPPLWRMIFSLAVIDKLSPGELNGGRLVAGTGTISEDGTVGPIGGIVHKVRAAEEKGTELFLAPADNCTEAISRDHGDMVIAKVTTLDDAITAMADFDAGRDVEECS